MSQLEYFFKQTYQALWIIMHVITQQKVLLKWIIAARNTDSESNRDFPNLSRAPTLREPISPDFRGNRKSTSTLMSRIADNLTLRKIAQIPAETESRPSRYRVELLELSQKSRSAAVSSRMTPAEDASSSCLPRDREEALPPPPPPSLYDSASAGFEGTPGYNE